jgi:hypothetical protein
VGKKEIGDVSWGRRGGGGIAVGKKEIGTGVEEEEEAGASLWGRIEERDEMKG